MTLAGGARGVLGGIAAVAVVARATGLPGARRPRATGPPRRRAPCSCCCSGPPRRRLSSPSPTPRRAVARREVRILDVLAIAAAGAAGSASRAGALDAGTLATGGDATFLLLLPGLVCFAAAVAAARLLGPLMRTGERLDAPRPAGRSGWRCSRSPARRRGRPRRRPSSSSPSGSRSSRPATGATLEQGAARRGRLRGAARLHAHRGAEARDCRSSGAASRGSTGSRRASTPTRFVRQTAEVPGPGTSVLSPTVLGLPPGALAGPALAERLRRSAALDARGAVSAPIRRLRCAACVPPRGAPLTLRARARGSARPARPRRGRPRTAPSSCSGSASGAAADSSRARPPRRLKLVGLEISVSDGRGDRARAPRGAEGTQSAIPRGSTRARAASRGAARRSPTGAAASPRGGADRRRAGRVSYAFRPGQTVLVRPRQATDGRPLRVIASPVVARAAGPGGRLVLDFGVGRVPPGSWASRSGFPPPSVRRGLRRRRREPARGRARREPSRNGPADGALARRAAGAGPAQVAARAREAAVRARSSSPRAARSSGRSPPTRSPAGSR